jgi:hypothetical protein
MWWPWVVGGLATWIVLALLLAVVVGRSIRLADLRSSGTGEDAVLTTADLPAWAQPTAGSPPAPVRARRRAVPLPTFGVVLVVLALALETTGYVLRLTGATGPSADLLSMDAPFSLPRMFVAFLFAAAALAAVVGARSIPGRRTWWVAVGLVAGGIAAVKAGSTVHSDVLRALDAALGAGPAVLVSALAAAVVIGALWFLSRTERRDRRRILGVLALYAVASVGLSTVSSSVGGTWAIAATYVEESGEALAAVAFLIAVLLGVAPRLVLPAGWALRRDADTHTLELPEGVQGRPATGGTTAQ